MPCGHLPREQGGYEPFLVISVQFPGTLARTWGDGVESKVFKPSAWVALAFFPNMLRFLSEKLLIFPRVGGAIQLPAINSQPSLRNLLLTQYAEYRALGGGTPAQGGWADVLEGWQVSPTDTHTTSGLLTAQPTETRFPLKLMPNHVFPVRPQLEGEMGTK